MRGGRVATLAFRAPSLSRKLCASASRQVVGLGCQSEALDNVSRATAFKIMMNVIDAPQRFYPVSSVTVRPAMGDAGDDGALWRSMTYVDGPLKGSVLVEHIYANPSAGEIRFVSLDEDGQESELEVVNQLHRSPLKIEYYLRDRESLERLHWDAPKADAMRAIDTTVAMARAKEIQQCDPTFVGNKA